MRDKLLTTKLKRLLEKGHKVGKCKVKINLKEIFSTNFI